MTQPQPPQPMIPFDPRPTEQRVDMAEITGPDGTKIIMLLIVQPLSTTVVYLDHEAARKLADQLFTRANGLQVVRDMPGGGG